MLTRDDAMVYIAGRYTDTTYNKIDRHIALAREYAEQLVYGGVDFFCPHTHTAHFECVTPGVPYDYWIKLDLKHMKHCQAALFLPGWEASNGARKEMIEARERGMLVFFTTSDVITWWNSLPEAA